MRLFLLMLSFNSFASTSLVVDDLNRVTDKCVVALVDDLAFPGSESLSRAVRQIVSVDENRFSYFTGRQLPAQMDVEQNQKYIANYDMASGRGGKYFTSLGDNAWLKTGFHIKIQNDQIADLWLVLPKGLPHITFEWIPSEYGETTGPRRIVTKAWVKFPDEYSETETFTNVDTELSSTLKPNYGKYVECLISGFSH
jgi:hypothetical protein